MSSTSASPISNITVDDELNIREGRFSKCRRHISISDSPSLFLALPTFYQFVLD